MTVAGAVVGGTIVVAILGVLVDRMAAHHEREGR
jgi:F0F1-type ATP synthase assembly protein I